MLYLVTSTRTIRNEKGEDKTIKEKYIVEGEIFADVELKMFQLWNNENDVTAISRSKISEIVNEKEEDKPFFKAEVIDVFTDENTGEEKEILYQMLVCASDVQDAVNKMNAWLKQGYNMTLKGVTKTKIVDYIK